MSQPTPKAPSPAAKALEYARNELRVDDVYKESRTILTQYDECLTALSEARDKKRDLDDAIDARKMEIIGDERAKHADMSEAAMDRHLRQVYRVDTRLIELKEQQRQAAGDVDGCEMDKLVHEQELKTLQARMTELGGYLNYLAAARLATIHKETMRDKRVNNDSRTVTDANSIWP
jgi:chromosome segregation ATPase